MKTTLALLTILMLIFTLSMDGQTRKKAKAKPAAKKSDIATVMGKPVYSSIDDSLTTKVWIIRQKKRAEISKTGSGTMMKTVKDPVMRMDDSTKGMLATGTHYFVFAVTNMRNGKDITDSTAKVSIVTPAKEYSSVVLHPMMNHFGSGITLDGKGEYLFTINVFVGSDYKTTQFKYKVL
jgi:hypothetical protein